MDDYQPTRRERYRITVPAGIGLTEKEIASLVPAGRGGAPITVELLRRHYGDCLDAGRAHVKANVGGRLYQMAMSDGAHSFQAAKWISQAVLGWTEKQEVEHTGASNVLVVPATMTVVDWVKQQEAKNDEREPPDGAEG